MSKPFYHEGHAEVDGEKLHLVCDFYAIDVIESITGERMDDILPQMVSPSHSLAVKVLYGLLRRAHEGLDLDDVAGFMFSSRENCARISAVMGDVLRRAMNVGEEPKAKDENPPKRRGRSKGSAKTG